VKEQQERLNLRKIKVSRRGGIGRADSKRISREWDCEIQERRKFQNNINNKQTKKQLND
jgi:hypothetical protein